MDGSQTESGGETLAQHIARQVRAEMARQGISQETLGERIGWDQRRVSRRVTGDVAIDANELELIAAALGMPVSQFLPATAIAAT